MSADHDTIPAPDFVALEAKEERVRAQLELHEALSGDLGDAANAFDFAALDRPGMVTEKLLEDLHVVHDVLLALQARVEFAAEHYREQQAALAERLHAGCACEER